MATEDLVKIEDEAMQWHEQLWSFRSEIISSIALVSMDDEEDFELEALHKNSDGKTYNEKWPWLTGHLIGHAVLIVLAHVYESLLFSLTALYSQCLFLALFLRAKALGDAVSNAVSVVRKFARNMASYVSVSSSERTLLQFQVLQNKMDFLTDVHESHQLGMGFFVPFVGTCVRVWCLLLGPPLAALHMLLAAMSCRLRWGSNPAPRRRVATGPQLPLASASRARSPARNLLIPSDSLPSSPGAPSLLVAKALLLTAAAPRSPRAD